MMLKLAERPHVIMEERLHHLLIAKGKREAVRNAIMSQPGFETAKTTFLANNPQYATRPDIELAEEILVKFSTAFTLEQRPPASI